MGLKECFIVKRIMGEEEVSTVRLVTKRGGELEGNGRRLCCVYVRGSSQQKVWKKSLTYL